MTSSRFADQPSFEIERSPLTIFKKTNMSHATVRKIGLKESLARSTFVMFVTRERDMDVLRSGASRAWTVPASARPGDRVLVYKPGETAGWAGGAGKPPYEAFVAAGVVYGKPRRLE